MKLLWLKRIYFISKSLLWSFLLYAVVTVILDWNEVKTTFIYPKDKIQVAGTPAGTQTPSKIGTDTASQLNKYLNLLKAIPAMYHKLEHVMSNNTVL